MSAARAPEVLGDRPLRRRLGNEKLIGAGAVCVYDDLRHLRCDLVQAFRLCEWYLLRPAP